MEGYGKDNTFFQINMQKCEKLKTMHWIYLLLWFLWQCLCWGNPIGCIFYKISSAKTIVSSMPSSFLISFSNFFFNLSHRVPKSLFPVFAAENSKFLLLFTILQAEVSSVFVLFAYVQTHFGDLLRKEAFILLKNKTLPEYKMWSKAQPGYNL